MEKMRLITGSLERNLPQPNKQQNQSDQDANSHSKTGYRMIGPVPKSRQWVFAMIFGRVDRFRLVGWRIVQLGLSSISARTVAWSAAGNGYRSNSSLVTHLQSLMPTN